MEASDVKITGILLAGGMSSRMGREKGMLRLGKLHLYEYPLKVLEESCDEILISTCNDIALPLAYPKVCDEQPGIGPLGGIYTCLKHSSNELNIVLSYDMPGVSTPLINYLLKEQKDFDIVVPALIAKSPEPLCGIYRKNALPVLEACIEKNDFAVHKALKMARTRIVPIEKHLNFWNPHLFANINRMEDLESLMPGFEEGSYEN